MWGLFAWLPVAIVNLFEKCHFAVERKAGAFCGGFFRLPTKRGLALLSILTAFYVRDTARDVLESRFANYVIPQGSNLQIR
jgi:hypothetical protein